MKDSVRIMKNARRTTSHLGYSMRHMDRDFSVPLPQKLLDIEARMKRCKEQPILDKLSRAGVYQALEDDVTDSGILLNTKL